MSDEFKMKEIAKLTLEEAGFDVAEDRLSMVMDKIIEKCRESEDLEGFKKCVIEVAKEELGTEEKTEATTEMAEAKTETESEQT